MKTRHIVAVSTISALLVASADKGKQNRKGMT